MGDPGYPPDPVNGAGMPYMVDVLVIALKKGLAPIGLVCRLRLRLAALWLASGQT